MDIRFWMKSTNSLVILGLVRSQQEAAEMWRLAGEVRVSQCEGAVVWDSECSSFTTNQRAGEQGERLPGEYSTERWTNNAVSARQTQLWMANVQAEGHNLQVSATNKKSHVSLDCRRSSKINKTFVNVSLKIHVFQVNVRKRFAYWTQPSFWHEALVMVTWPNLMSFRRVH